MKSQSSKGYLRRSNSCELIKQDNTFIGNSLGRIYDLNNDKNNEIKQSKVEVVKESIFE